MANRKQKKYDDDELVLALAVGERSHSQIARDFGLSRTMIAGIARGASSRCAPVTWALETVTIGGVLQTFGTIAASLA